MPLQRGGRLQCAVDEVGRRDSDLPSLQRHADRPLQVGDAGVNQDRSLAGITDQMTCRGPPAPAVPELLPAQAGDAPGWRR